MKTNARRIVSWIAALTLLLTCAISGIVLPAAAETPATFKLADEVLYVAHNDPGGWLVYFATHAITPEGELYTEPLTWSTSDSSIVAIHKAETGLFKAVTKVDGEATITATNAAGESASCKVIVTFDGERICGGDFEHLTVNADTSRWNALLKVRKETNQGDMVADPQNPNNTVMSWPCNNAESPYAAYYAGLTVEPEHTYKFSFDVKGADATSPLFYIRNGSKGGTALSSNVEGFTANGWQSITTKETEWTHVEYIIKTGSEVDRSNFLGFDNINEGKLLYFDNFSFTEMGSAESITLSETELEMKVGDEADLTVDPTPSDATFNRVQWMTSDANVATVVDGKITAVGAGSATITAISGMLVATCKVDVVVPPASFKLADEVLYVAHNDPGGWVVYFATHAITPEGELYTEPLTWSTSDSSIVAIHKAETGLFKAVTKVDGEATITATNAAGESASCKVIVTFDGERICGGDFEHLTVNADTSRWNALLKVRKETNQGDMVADPQNPNNTVMSWPCNNPESASAAYYAGLTVEPEHTYKFSFDVKGADATSPLFYIRTGAAGGTALSSNIEGFTANGWQSITTKETEWTHVEYIIKTGSSVDRSNFLGFDNINEGKLLYFDNFSFTEVGSAESIILSETELDMDAGDEVTLTVSPNPSDATFNRVQWMSSDETVATVVDGKIVAVSSGRATITALSGTLTAICQVTVTGEGGQLPPGDDDGFIAKVDFDNPLKGFTTLKNDNYVMEGAGIDGSKAFVVSGVKNDYVDIVADANIMMLPGETYIMRFKTKGGGMRLEFGPSGTYYQIPLTETYGVPAFTTGDTEWTTYQRVIRATTSMLNFTWLRVKFDCDNTPVYIDDIVLIKVDDLMAEIGSFDLEAGRYGLTALESVAPAGDIVTDPLNAEDPTDRVLSFPKKTESETAPYATLENAPFYLDSATSKRQAGVFYPGRPYTLSMDVYGAAMGVYFDSNLSVSVLDHNAEKSGDGWYQVGGDATKDGWKTYTFTVYTENTAKVFDKLFAFAKNADAAAEYSDVTAATYIDNITLVPKAVAPNALVLNKTELLLGLNNTEKLTMTPDPSYATVGKLTWASSDETVATVKNGTVTAVGVGTATITLTHGDISATCAVTVVDEAVSFTLEKDTMHLAPGTSKSPILVTVPANTKPGTITWTSDKPDVATVDAATGRVTAVANGTAVITGKKGNATVTCTVTVDEKGERISGGDFEMDDWNNDTFTTNLVKAGVGTVVADSDNMVLQLPDSANAALYLASLNLEDGKDYRLTFKAKGTKVRTHINGENVTQGAGETDKDLKTGSWTTVTVAFTYKAGGDKNAVIGFSNQGGSGKTLYLDDISLVQLPAATDITIIPGTIELLPGTTNPLMWAPVPSDAFISDAGIQWSSSDPSIVAVDPVTGEVTALGKDGQSADITVTNGTFSKTVKATITDYANLLWNGDFEQGASVNWGDNAKIKPGIGKDGGYGIELTANGDNYFKGDIPAKPGTKYTLSFDYLPTSGSKFKVWSSKLGIGNCAGVISGTGWQNKTITFTTPAAMDISNVGWIIAIVGEKVGTKEPVVVDNVSIRLYTSGVEATEIELSRDTMTLMPGRTGSLAIHATPINGDVNRVTWTSDNEDVATVEYGVVTGVGKGTAKITATLNNGLKASCMVRVSGNDAFVNNGTFTNKDDDSWTFSETGAEIIADRGVLDSNAVSLTTGGSIKHQITGLKPETSYQIFVRFRSDVKSNKILVDLSNATTTLFNNTPGVATGWTKGIYEFTTGAEVSETDVFTLTLAAADGSNGPILVDNVFLAEKATMIDFVVDDVFWLLTNDETAPTDQVKPGEELTFYVTIRNQGTDAVKVGDTMMVDICMDGKPIMSIPHTFASALPSGESDYVQSTVPWAAVKGDHVISARVNSTLSILEIDDTNNNTQQKDLRVNEVILEVPEIADLAGFNELIFSDDFNSADTFDTKATGADGYKWYVTRPWTTKDGVQHIGEDYKVEDGILTLQSVVPTYNYTLGTQDINTKLGFEWQYGYMEVRFRIPRPRENEAGEDGVPAIWSLPPSKLHGADTNLNWVEMDWMEYWGINGLDSDRPNGFYTISMHDTYKVGGTTMGQYKNSNYSKGGLGDAEWHTMSWLWQKGVVIAYLDGVAVFRQEFSGEDVPDPLPNVVSNADGSYDMVGAFSHLDEESLVLFLGASKDNPMELDYVRIWSGIGDGVTPPTGGDDDDEFGDDVVLDTDANDFCDYYCTDEEGDPILTVTEDNYYNILGVFNEEIGEYDGVYLWEHLTDARRDEINAILATRGQPSYDELLAAALRFANGELPDDDDSDLSPDTGEHTAVPAVAALVALSAAAVWVTRKRKKTQA